MTLPEPNAAALTILPLSRAELPIDVLQQSMDVAVSGLMPVVICPGIADGPLIRRGD